MVELARIVLRRAVAPPLATGALDRPKKGHSTQIEMAEGVILRDSLESTRRLTSLTRRGEGGSTFELVELEGNWEATLGGGQRNEGGDGLGMVKYEFRRQRERRPALPAHPCLGRRAGHCLNRLPGGQAPATGY